MSCRSDELKAAVTCKDVIEMYTGLRVKNGFCQCPLHQGDRTPSMKLYPGSRGFYCFGCHQGGDVIKLMMLISGLGFRAACQQLSDDFALGIDFGKRPTYKERREQETRRLQREEHVEDDAAFEAMYQRYLDCIDDPNRQDEAEYLIKWLDAHRGVIG